jgi:hypothetical protein
LNGTHAILLFAYAVILLEETVVAARTKAALTDARKQAGPDVNVVKMRSIVNILERRQ